MAAPGSPGRRRRRIAALRPALRSYGERVRSGAGPTSDVAELASFLWQTFPGRCVQRFLGIEGIDRSLVLASQAFTAIIPILILGSTLAPTGSENAMSDAIIRVFYLDGDSAAAVQQLFTIPPEATGGLSVASVLLLLFSGVSFTRRLQRMYLSAWDREKAGVRSSMFAGLGLLVLVAEAAVLYAVRSLVRGLPLDWLLMIPLSAMAGLVLWTSIPWLLMNREVYWRRLIAAGALASTATTIYSVATAVYMPDLVDRYTAEFGLFGITIAIIGWLLVIAMVLVASSAVGAEFDSSPDRWAMSLKTRLRLYDPEQGPLPAGAVGRPPPRGSSPHVEFVNPFLLGRLAANWLVITFAVWLTASIVPGIVVYGGFLTYLWVSLLLGLVNAVIGPVAHIIALPVTVVTLGLFALVVNGLLLAVTAALTAGLGVDGFLATVVGATLIASVTAALDFLVSPIRPRPDRL